MIKYLKILTTILLLFPLWGQGGYLFAQNYPVQCTPILSPPYTLSWVEYGSSPERLKVQLLLKDLTKTSVEVSLRIRLKGIGVIIENVPDFYSSSPITLLPGVPVVLSGAMLRENFRFENLTAQGVDLEALYAGLSLPSGFYQWEITAFLADQRQVSNVGMAMMTVFKNNPPQITFPQNKAVLMNTGFQSINFTWMPRHRYSTNAAAGTIYTFKIYEIPTDENEETDPNVIVNSGVLPLFSTQSFGTNYTYKPSDPVLVPGRRYVIQVQAADINGLDEFENNGLSEVSTFSFGNPSEAPAIKPCKKPTNVLAEKLDEQSVQLTWQEINSEAPIDYLVSYKTENESFWNERIVADPSLILVQLAPAKYKFKVYARCTYDNKSAFTNEMSVILESPKPEETPEAEPQDTYVNTDEPVTPPTTYEPEPESEPAIDPITTPIRIIFESESLPDSLKSTGLSKLGSLPVLSDKPSLAELKSALKTNKVDCSALLANYQCGQNEIIGVPSGDIIQVKTGDEIAINSIAFEVVELDGSGNGSGIVKVPMFNNAKFGVDFKGIKVAKGGCVVEGQAELSHVDFALLSEKERAKLAEVYKAFNLVLTIADSLAPQIAKGINDLNDKLFEKKRNARELLAKTNVENLTEVLTNCTDISSQGRTLQDSLEKAICLVKAGKLKAKLSSLEEASKANIEFMNKLGPALANCQGKPKWEDWTQKPCSGPCGWDYSEFTTNIDCREELKIIFKVDDKSINDCDKNIKDSPELLALAKKAISKNCGTGVDNEIGKFSDLFTKLCDVYRYGIIECLSETPCDGEDEKNINKLLQTTPKADIEKIKSAILRNDNLNNLISAIDDDNFDAFINILASKQFSGSKPSNIEKTFIFDGDDGHLYSIDENGYLTFGSRHNFTLSYYQEEKIRAFDWITVIFAADFIWQGKKYPQGYIAKMPAIELWGAFNESGRKKSKLAVSLLVDIGLTYVGVGAIKNISKLSKVYRVLTYTKIGLDVTTGLGGFVMAVGLEDELELTQDGKEVLAYWTWFNLTYGTASLSYEGVAALYRNADRLLESGKSLSSSMKSWLPKLKTKLEELAKSKGWKLVIKEIVDLKGSNSMIVNGIHTITNVRFEEKIIEYGGKIYKGLFAQFNYVFRCRISEDIYLASDYIQMTSATKLLKEQILKLPSLASKFSSKALQDIMDEKRTISGWIWHHYEEAGFMDLVDETIHSKTSHIGGKKIWGGER